MHNHRQRTPLIIHHLVLILMVIILKGDINAWRYLHCSISHCILLGEYMAALSGSSIRDYHFRCQTLANDTPCIYRLYDLYLLQD